MRDDRPLQNPEEITRILFEDFSGWAIGLFYPIGFTSIGIANMPGDGRSQRFCRRWPDGCARW